MKHIEIMNNGKSSKRNLHYSTMPQLLRRIVAICLLALTSIGAWAEDYVFMQGSNYIIISGGSLTTTTTFNPSTCLWSGTSGGAFTNNGNTLMYSQTYTESGNTRTYSTTLNTSLNTSETNVPLVISADGTIQFTANVSATYRWVFVGWWEDTPGTWYIQYNGSNVVASTTSSSTNNIKAYLVTTTEIPALTYITGIDGIDAIGLTGTYNYTRIGSAIATTPACTKYTFNSTNYYKLSDNTITTTAPVSEEFTYTWSATCNDATYTGFSINSSTGALSITSLPTTDKTLTITLQATKSGFETQTVTKTVNISNRHPTGTVGGTVYLNDCEDHTWTYYAGVDESVDGGNYNTNYAGKMYSPDPRNVKITYQANGGAVSIDEDETEFIYYKTIEKVGGTYKYQVISNPFSKRPTGKGFDGWEVVSGGSYIGKTDGDVLELDEELTLTAANLKNVAGGDYVPNCTSAEIVLQAHWVDATIKYGVSNISSSDFNGGTYETNILVLNLSSNTNQNLSPSYPVTIMMVEPDGSADYRTYTFTGSITPPSGGIAKIEHAKWAIPNSGVIIPTYNINMEGANLWIGRGITITGTTPSVTLAGNSVSNQIVKIESGKYSTLTHYSGSPNTNSTTPLQRLTLGNDYDRAKKDWETSTPTLEFTGTFILAPQINLLGQGANIVSDNTSGANTYMAKVLSKSGKFMTNISIEAAANGNSYYLSAYGTSGRTGKRYLEIEGGEWVNIAGGRDDDRNGTKNTEDYIAFALRMRGGHVKGSIYGGAEQYSVQGSRQIVITGGEVNGWVAGGANGTSDDNGATTGMSYVYVGGNAIVNSNNSTTSIGASLGGNVYGAGCGYNASSTSGQMTLGTNIVLADNAYVERGVYGGGAFGYCPTDITSNVYVTGGHVLGRSGNYTDRGGNTTNGIIGGVFGGARQRSGGYANVYMTGGLVGSGLFGGSNNSGTIANDVKVVVTGGQVGTTSTTANIHGGGYGQNTGVSGNVDVTLGTRNTTTGVTSGTAVVYGDVYGGSALGNVNGTTAADTYHTNVTLNAGTINGSLYGGALGNSTTEANVYGPVAVEVYGGSVNTTTAVGSGAVYGCNNVNGAPKSTVTVDIYGTDPAPVDGYALDAVYGGGNMADYEAGTPTVKVHNCNNSIGSVYGGGNAADITGTDHGTSVTIYGGNVIGNVFGGGNGEREGTEANVAGDVSVNIHGGTILNVYGGSNTTGTIGGNISVTVNSQAESTSGTACPMAIDNVYGGGNKAASKAGTITIGCTGTYVAASGTTPESGYIRNVYGGANQANITNEIALNIKSGHIDNIFGGNNNGGSISGKITVNVDWEDGCTSNYIGNVYGGGNVAAYTAPATTPDYPQVNIRNAVVEYDVFGGGLGTTAVVTGNPKVNINTSDCTNTEHSDHLVTVKGSVYGGGSAAAVKGNSCVLIKGADGDDNKVTVKTNVFGGGLGADAAIKKTSTTSTDGNTTIRIEGNSTIEGNVYGGGNAGAVEGNTDVQIGSDE